MEIPVGTFAVERTTDAAAEETRGNLENRGFAGGCNRGISHALRYGADFVWLYLRPTLDACRIVNREGGSERRLAENSRRVGGHYTGANFVLKLKDGATQICNTLRMERP